MTYFRRATFLGLAVCILTWLLRLGVASAQPNGGTPPAGQSAAPPAAATKAPAGKGVAPSDLEFLKSLHATNQLDIKIGRAAKDRVGSDAATSFALKMVSDHGAQDKKLATFLKGHGLRISVLGPVPSEVPAAHAAYKAKTGAAYDHAFAEQMVSDYHAWIEQVERVSKETADDGVRVLLDQLLPTLRVLEATARVLADQKEHA
jgi:predicted outer membrane protein